MARVVFAAATFGAVSPALAQEIAIPEPQDVAGRRPQPDYDAVGIRFGSILVYPEAEFDVDYDSNLYARSSDVVSDLAATVTPRVTLVRRQPGENIAVTSHLSLRRYLTQSQLDDEQYGLSAHADREFGRATMAALDLSYNSSTAERGTFENDLSEGTPLRRDSLTGQVAARHRFNRLVLDLGGVAERSTYDDVTLSDGTVLSQSFRDVTRLGGALGASYEVGARLSLTAKGQYTRFDYASDGSSSPIRDATQVGVLLGARYEPSRLMTVSLGLGWRSHDFDEAAYGTISGLAVEGRMRWYPTPLLTFRADISQSTKTSSFDQISAVSVTEMSTGADYEYRRNIILSLDASFADERYGKAGDAARRGAIDLRARWKMNRSLSMRANVGVDSRFDGITGLVSTYSGFHAGLGIVLAR